MHKVFEWSFCIRTSPDCMALLPSIYYTPKKYSLPYANDVLCIWWINTYIYVGKWVER